MFFNISFFHVDLISKDDLIGQLIQHYFCRSDKNTVCRMIWFSPRKRNGLSLSERLAVTATPFSFFSDAGMNGCDRLLFTANCLTVLPENDHDDMTLMTMRRTPQKRLSGPLKTLRFFLPESGRRDICRHYRHSVTGENDHG